MIPLKSIYELAAHFTHPQNGYQRVLWLLVVSSKDSKQQQKKQKKKKEEESKDKQGKPSSKPKDVAKDQKKAAAVKPTVPAKAKGVRRPASNISYDSQRIVNDLGQLGKVWCCFAC